MCSAAAIVVCAWGVDGKLHGRGALVRRQLRHAGVKLHYLALTKDGSPGHPLRKSHNLAPTKWLP